MSRRWWIASGVLIAVLAIASVVMNRIAAGPTSSPAPRDLGPVPATEGWDVAAWDGMLTLPQPVLGGLALVVLGVAVAVAALAGRRGARRRRVESAASIPSDGAAQASSTWPVLALGLVVVGLVAGGIALVGTHGVEEPVLANGAKGIAALDNIAAVPTGVGIATEVDQFPAASVLGWDDAGAGLVGTTRVAAFAWAAAVLGLLLVVAAVAYAVGRRRWAVGVPLGALGAVLVAGGLVLAALAPPPQGAVLYWGAYTPLTGLSLSDPYSGAVASSAQDTMPMPDVVGLDYYEAEAELRSFGFREIRRLEPRRANQGMEPDFVVTQYPAAGQQVLPGDVVVVLDVSAP